MALALRAHSLSSCVQIGTPADLSLRGSMRHSCRKTKAAFPRLRYALVEVARMDLPPSAASPLRGALRASKTDFVAFCELATLVRLAPSAQMKKARPMGEPFSIWWRWRESNSRPQVLRAEVYMLIPSLVLPEATRRAGKTSGQLS